MITLFESFSDESKEIYQSNKAAGLDTQYVVLNDDGFLPNDIMTPYRFFSEEPIQDDSPRYFNQIDLPKFWEIESTNNEGTAFDLGELRARLIYKTSYRSRIISEVHWLDKKGSVVKKDLYSKYGHLFSSIVLNNGSTIFQEYYDMKGKVIIYCNNITGHIILTWKDKDCLFENSTSFYRFFLEQAQYDLSSILINSLSSPLLLTVNLKQNGNDYFFLQEKFDSIPGNLQYILEHTEKRNFKVIVPDEEGYLNLLKQLDESYHHRIYKLGYIYRYKNELSFNKRILITTHSDQIFGLEELVKQLSDFEFNIAALTEMSERLTVFNKYENVKLYPGISPNVYQELFDSCAIYLDINEGTEVMTSIRDAFDHQILILGYEDTLHQKRYIPKTHIFLKENVHNFIEFIKFLAQDDVHYNNAVQLQKTTASEVSSEQYRKVLN